MKNDRILNNLLWNDKIGTIFEQDAVFCLNTVLNDRLKNVTDAEADTKEGTDAFYYMSKKPLRIDFTLNFSNKDNMPFIYETDIPATNINNFKIGIRIGNTFNEHTSFKEPVIVIGVDLENYYENDNIIMSNMTKYAEKLMLIACDCYLDYTATTEDDREAIFDSDLKSNPKYTEHEKTSEKFKNLNKLRRIIEQKQHTPDPGDKEDTPK